VVAVVAEFWVGVRVGSSIGSLIVSRYSSSFFVNFLKSPINNSTALLHC
jgi:hypothetical protein